MSIEVREQKQALRAAMKDKRAQLHASNPQAGEQLRDAFFKYMSLPPHAVIAGFKPFGSEIDMLPLTDALRAAGHVIALPVVAGKGQPLVFRRYQPGDELIVTKFGTAEPVPSAPKLDPDFVLTPLLAFDRLFYRLGYGRGFYDHTLVDLRARKTIMAIGLAFAGQEVAAVPHDVHDARLDKIVTEIHAL